MSDHEAYESNPVDRIWYNKLFVAGILNYRAGQGRIPENGRYVIKPKINLDGCGIGARMGYYFKDEIVPEGYFWSEVFTGRHITIDYSKINGIWQQEHTFEGFKEHAENLQQFSLWRRVDYSYQLPRVLNTVQAEKLNIEIIGDRIIEVHLRHSTDPVQYDVFIPIWHQNQPCPAGYCRIDDVVDFPGRLGFFVSESK